MPKTELITITHPYRNHEGVKSIASVNLTIDYDEKNFSVESSCHDGAFRFQKNSHKHAMWEALAICITEGIRVGTEKLKLE